MLKTLLWFVLYVVIVLVDARLARNERRSHA